MNLDLLKKANVLVIGDIILDKYIHGSVDRASPEAPVPVLRPESEESFCFRPILGGEFFFCIYPKKLLS